MLPRFFSVALVLSETAWGLAPPTGGVTGMSRGQASLDNDDSAGDLGKLVTLDSQWEYVSQCGRSLGNGCPHGGISGNVQRSLGELLPRSAKALDALIQPYESGVKKAKDEGKRGSLAPLKRLRTEKKRILELRRILCDYVGSGQVPQALRSSLPQRYCRDTAERISSLGQDFRGVLGEILVYRTEILKIHASLDNPNMNALEHGLNNLNDDFSWACSELPDRERLWCKDPEKNKTAVENTILSLRRNNTRRPASGLKSSTGSGEKNTDSQSELVALMGKIKATATAAELDQWKRELDRIRDSLTPGESERFASLMTEIEKHLGNVQLLEPGICLMKPGSRQEARD